MSGNTVIPFGKYRGQEVAQIMQRDPAYVQWLVQQAWFSEKFSPIYQLVVNNFQVPSDETPEHNALQVRFLDFDFRRAFFAVTNIKIGWQFLTERAERLWPDHQCSKTLNFSLATFEDISDVWFSVRATVAKADDKDPYAEKFNIAVEIKPSMGDDYPAVLRQIKRQKIAADGATSWEFNHYLRWFLLVDHFASNVVTLDQVRQIFRQDGIGIVLLSDVRDCLNQTKAERA